MNNLSKIHTFDDFRFDASRFALYNKGEMIKDGDKKTMQVLAVLLLNPNKLSTHNEIIEQVWEDNPLGVTSGHIGQYISKLRKIFAKFAPEKHYIETVKGRGYSFVGDVSSDESEILPNLKYEPDEYLFNAPERTDNLSEKVVSRFILPKFALVFPALISVILIVFIGWTWFSQNDEEEIRRVVKESQFYESLVVYKNPTSFDNAALDKYWTNELDINQNYDRHRIREAAKKLADEGRHYGSETKCEQFEFQSIEINQDKNFAVVKTLEKWFIAVYFTDGTLQKNKYVGPYFVSYILRKIDGRWLIEKSNTARISRPTPRLSNIEAVSEMKSGQQFFVKLNGQDFETETVYIAVFGVGCPENNPCKVLNAALREHSKLTETELNNVPLTLASGDFRIEVRNGDSQASNTVYLKVP